MTSGTTERDDIKYIENRLNRVRDFGHPSMNLNNGFSTSEYRKYPVDTLTLTLLFIDL